MECERCNLPVFDADAFDNAFSGEQSETEQRYCDCCEAPQLEAPPEGYRGSQSEVVQ